MEYISHSVEYTEQLAATLALEISKRYLSGDDFVIALFGDMGMGKTAFVRGLAKGLDYTGEVTSPTFALVHEYVGGIVPLYHFDMYRVVGFDSLCSTGFFDYIDLGGIMAVEWSENIKEYLPDNALRITFSRIDDDQRKIDIPNWEGFV